MKKFILCLIVFIFFAQIAVAADVTIAGRVKSISVKDKWIVIKIEKGIIAKFLNTLKQLVRIETKKIGEYQVNILDTTKIENVDKESVILDKIVVGENINVTGKILREMSEKEPGLIEASYIRVVKFKSISVAITNFFGFNQGSQLVGVRNENSIVTGEPSKITDDKLPVTPKVFERDDCVSEGEPVLYSFLLAPKKPDTCCKDENGEEYLQICPISNTEVNSITINGFSYVIKGYCRKECKKEESTTTKLLPLLPLSLDIKLYECYKDSDCCSRSIALCNKQCVNNKCVEKSILNIGGTNGWCDRNEDCSYENGSCVSGGGIGFLNLFTSKLKCVCDLATHSCKSVQEEDKSGCDKNITCSDETVFVCGKDGKTYQNPCEAVRCDTEIKCVGKCPCQTSTTTIPTKPGIIGKCSVVSDCELCGNECFESTMLAQLKNSGKTCGESEENIQCKCQDGNCIMDTYIKGGGCDDIVELVCGSDGKTYQSKCKAEEENVKISCEKACPCDVVAPPVICPAVYQPVCGLNNKTYSNSCVAHGDGIDIKCNQACPCTTTTTSTTTTTTTPKTSTPSGTWKEILVNGFCGVQTEGSCVSDSDCKVGGCSGTICQAKSEPSAITTCDWQNCYQKPSNVYCGCDNGKCKWYSALTSGSSIQGSTGLPTLNPGLGITPITTPTTLPSEQPKICLMVMSCLNGKVLSADCGEAGNKCYDFTETGNGNCYCN